MGEDDYFTDYASDYAYDPGADPGTFDPAAADAALATADAALADVGTSFDSTLEPLTPTTSGLDASSGDLAAGDPNSFLNWNPPSDALVANPDLTGFNDTLDLSGLSYQLSPGGQTEAGNSALDANNPADPLAGMSDAEYNAFQDALDQAMGLAPATNGNWSPAATPQQIGAGASPAGFGGGGSGMNLGGGGGAKASNPTPNGPAAPYVVKDVRIGNDRVITLSDGTVKTYQNYFAASGTTGTATKPGAPATLAQTLAQIFAPTTPLGSVLAGNKAAVNPAAGGAPVITSGGALSGQLLDPTSGQVSPTSGAHTPANGAAGPGLIPLALAAGLAFFVFRA